MVAGLILVRRKPTEAMQGNLPQLTKNAAERKKYLTPDNQYLKVFDELSAYDFNTFVGGHLTSIGTNGMPR